MKLFFATLGSRGDYEPFLNLAIGAKQAGHEVYLAATEEFTESTKAAGITPIEFRGTMKDLIQDSGISVSAAMKQFKTVIKPLMIDALDKTVETILESKPDAVIFHPKVLSAPVAARKIGAKSFVVELAPLVSPTSKFAAAGIAGRDLGILNKLSYALVAQSASLFKRELRELSEKLGVSNMNHDFSLCAVSPALLERPSDWPETTLLVGPWIANKKAGKLPLDMANFLDRKPTAYFGFGSMVAGDAQARTKLCIEAARAAGLQSLIVGGWGGLAEPGISDDVFFAEAVDHGSVFDKVSVAVHHGGAGTTHAALRAGTPSVIIPFLADQPWWGDLLFSKGLSPKLIAQKSLTIPKLRKALLEALELREGIQLIAEKMKTESSIPTTLCGIQERL